MLLLDAYGADHIWCMIVANDYHGLFRSLVFVINVMYIIQWNGHVKAHEVIICLFLS